MTTYIYLLDGDSIAINKSHAPYDTHHKDQSTNDSSESNCETPLESLSNTSAIPTLSDIAEDWHDLIMEEGIEFEGVFDSEKVYSTNNKASQTAKQSTQKTSTQTNIQLSTQKNTQQNTETTSSHFAKKQTIENDKHLVVSIKNLPNDWLHSPTFTDNFEIAPVRSLFASFSTQQIYPVFKAMQVLRWRQEHTFCSRCGGRTSPHRHELAMVCNTCQYRQYPRLQPCVIVAITRQISADTSQILLAKDRRFKLDMHSVIAGFVEVGETLEQAVQREVYEETSLHVDNISYLGSQPWAFPSNLMVAFHAECIGGELSIDTDELVHAQFYDYDDLPNIPPKGSIAHSMIRHICDGVEFEV